MKNEIYGMSSRSAIKGNQFKLYAYMFALTLIIGVLGVFISSYFNFGLTGTGIFLLVAGVIDFIAYYFSDTLVIKSEHAKPISRETIPDYYDLVEELCNKNNLKIPKLYMIDSKSINAFATGRNIDKAALVVSRGLLEKLKPDEIKGVVGHELAHIESGDMKLMSVLSILVGIISILSDMFWYNNAVNRVSERDSSGISVLIGIILSIFAPLTSLLIKLSVSRTREFTADARGAEISGNPEFLANALNKIKHDRIELPHVNSATAHLYIASPYKSDFIENLFSTHPNIEERIQRLLNMKIN